MLAVTKFSSCPLFLRAICEVTWVPMFWTWAIFLTWQCPHNEGIIIAILDKHPGKGSLGINSHLLRCEFMCVCKRMIEGIKMSYLAGVLVPLTHLEQDFSLLTSYVPTSSEIAPPAPFTLAGQKKTQWWCDTSCLFWMLVLERGEILTRRTCFSPVRVVQTDDWKCSALIA